MNLEELLAKINAKVQDVKNLVASGKTEEAKAAKKELVELQDQYDLLKDLDNDLVSAAAGNVGVKVVDNLTIAQKAEKAFANAARMMFPKDSLNEGTNSDGGYTVPEDIQTRIETLREAQFNLAQLVTVVPVKTKSGARTFKARSSQTGFTSVSEGGAIGAKSTPTFSRITYSVTKYAGYFPVTDEVLEDTDQNLTAVLVDWIGNESRVTRNKIIVNLIKTQDQTTFTGLDDIKKCLNVTLGSAFKNTSKIITNDDGLQYLDTLKDSDGKYLLSPNPSNPMQLRLAAGATTVEVVVVPNDDLASVAAKRKTSDSAVVSGKTYYTLSGTTYTEVGSPSTASIANYYEDSSKVPFIVGDLKEGIVFFDRKHLTIKASDVASVSAVNAFEDDMTLWRAIEREDCKIRDAQAFVYGCVEIGA